MTNQIVWGAPHVFAVFLILAASGALNVASVASVFGRAAYKPLARLSGVVAIALLLGGLCILVLDLGRPDRLIVAMTYYNFRSIFAWNVFLYTGFLALTAVYLWTLMERRLGPLASAAGTAAFVWRIVLTTGTGSIFGFLVAREAYDAAVMAPLFVAMSLAYGTAVFLLVLMAACRWCAIPLADALVERLGRLLALFTLVVLYLCAVQHLANLYVAEHAGVERFLLIEGGAITAVFWLGQITLGSVLPLLLVYTPVLGSRRGSVGLAAALAAIGGLCAMYVIIIGGQAYPLRIFPDRDVLESTFFDGAVATYAPSAPEIGLGVGGIALAGLVVVLAVRVFRMLPVRVDDDPTEGGAA